MVQVKWTTAALEELAEVRDYARQLSPGYAEQLIERIIRIMYEIVSEVRVDIIHIHPTAKPLPDRR